MGIKVEQIYILDSYLSHLQTPLTLVNEEFLSEGVISKLEHSYTTNMRIVKNILRDYKIDLSFVEKRAKLAAKNNIKFLERKDQKGSLKAWSEELRKMLTSDKIKPILLKVARNVAISLAIVLAVYFLQVYIAESVLLIKFAGINMSPYLNIVSKTGAYLSVVVLGPFIEELAKRIAILGKFPWIYTGMFAFGEFVYYIVQFSTAPIFVLTRLGAVGLHFVLTAIQKSFHDLSLTKDKKFLSYVGFLIAFILHALNNFKVIFTKGYGEYWMV